MCVVFIRTMTTLLPQLNPLRLPLFGWSRKNPPDPERYLLEASDEFVDMTGSDPQPKPALIQRLIQELFDPDDPRFAVLTGLHQKLGLSKVQVHLFQYKVMAEIGKIKGFIAENDHYLVGNDFCGIHTTKTFHFDNGGDPQAPLISLAYGPFKIYTQMKGSPG